MKKTKLFFFAAIFAIPMLMFSAAKAHGGHDKDNNSGIEKDNKFGEDLDKDSKKGSSVPIDGGISLLLAAGVGLGIKKVAANRKRKNQVPTTPIQ